MTYSHVKVQGRSQLVQKIEWKWADRRSNRCDYITFLANGAGDEIHTEGIFNFILATSRRIE